MRVKGTPEQRFWARVARTPGCWEWQAGFFTQKGKRTYGAFRVNGKHDKQQRAHRVAWVLVNGPIPKGLHVLHRCDNRACVRPDHLFLGTHQDNMADKMAKGRHRAPSGEQNGQSRMTSHSALEAQERWVVGESFAAIGRRIGVSEAAIRHVVHGRTWKRVRYVAA